MGGVFLRTKGSWLAFTLSYRQGSIYIQIQIQILYLLIKKAPQGTCMYERMHKWLELIKE
jgi:hypothetical protein